jgi:nucleoside-diphosphate-sugar epimerase
MDWPRRFDDTAQLDAFLAQPSDALIDDLAAVEGDILILGAGGKMGPSLARLARNAAPGKRVTAVARFSEAGLQQALHDTGVETIRCDLLDREAVAALPRVANVIFMAGQKFGASGNPALTWAMNVHVPGIVAPLLHESRVVVFSTGNVYPLVPVRSGGASECVAPQPVGEYAQSCLGRERIFQHFGGAGVLFRLNYAIDLRYGVLHDIASKLRAGVPIDLAMGHVNVIWQGDANAQALRALRHCASPMAPLNVSGPETLSVRWLATELGARLGVAPQFRGEEAPVALLTNASRAASLFGYPDVPVLRMLDWVADWVKRDQPSLGKPTKFEVRDGAF